MKRRRGESLPALDLEQLYLDVSRQTLQNLGIPGVVQEERYGLLEFREGRGARRSLNHDVEFHAACDEEAALALNDGRELVAAHSAASPRQAPGGSSVGIGEVRRGEIAATLRSQF